MKAVATSSVLALLCLAACTSRHSGSSNDDDSTGSQRLPDGGRTDPIECEVDERCPEGVLCLGGFCDLRWVDAAQAQSPLPTLDGGFMFPDLDAALRSPEAEAGCKDNSDCQLIGRECCGACPLAFRTVVAVDGAGATEFEAACEGQTCAECDERPEDVVAALCVANKCVVATVDHHGASSRCESHADCEVRTATCCECAGPVGPGQLVAVSSASAFEQYVCGGSDSCDADCSLSYPPEVEGLCSGGFCLVADPRP